MKEPKGFLGKFVHDKGRKFYAALLPDDIERGEVGDCFDWCLIQAAKSGGKYSYCEGVAFVKGKWIHHAWMTDREGHMAYDPTWRAVRYGEMVPLEMVHYIGAKLDLDAVMEFVIRTGYKSPFANHKKAPDLAQAVYETAR